MSIKLNQPIAKGGIRITNFFNGRLVTGADMTREQSARREAVRRVGLAAGTGIAYGLEVTKARNVKENEPVVTVSAGLAVNRCGQALYLAQEESVNLLQRFGAVEQASTIFSSCQPLQPGTYAAGFRLYLLVLSPAESSEGRAPTSGLQNAFAACGTDMLLETAQFRLLPIDPFLAGEALPASTSLLQNYVAYRCFGAFETPEFFANPLGLNFDVYGLIDEMREKVLSDNDVPLAIINWTSSNLRFVEMWAVRRRLTVEKERNDWTHLVSDRRRSEAEAMMRQFADHVERLQVEESNLRRIQAEDYFQFLPPAGLLPLATAGANNGFDFDEFFGPKGSQEIALLDGDRLRTLLNDALTHEPIDMDADDKVQLYFVRENLDAVNNQQAIQPTLVFARHSLPYYGTARFGRAEWDLSRFAGTIR